MNPPRNNWAALILFAPKKDGSGQFFVDYWKPHAVAKRDSYTIPPMNVSIDSLDEAEIISTLDAISGYQHIEFDVPHRKKTAFKSHHGLYQLIRIPFELWNDSGSFQRTTHDILPTVKLQFALDYLDDVEKFSEV